MSQTGSVASCPPQPVVGTDGCEWHATGMWWACECHVMGGTTMCSPKLTHGICS